MRITKMLIGLLLVLCVACDKSERETQSGLKFKIVKEGTGVPTKVGDVLLFNVVFKDSKDSVWGNSYESEFPAAVPIDTTGIKKADGLRQLINMLTPGDSVVLNISIKDFYKDIAKNPIPAQVDSTLILTFQFKAEQAMTRDSFMTYRRNFYMKKQKEQVAKDSAAIEAYLTKNNITAQKTESGLYYVITTPGKGENGKSGQSVKVNYVGYTLDGVYFDTSVKDVAMEKGLYDPQREQFAPYAPYDVTIDRSQVIMGWHEALKVLNKGSKATIFVPSTMAYGPQGKGTIKPNESLVFELEVVDIKEQKDEK